MKADIYIQGCYQGSIELPHDGLLALLAQGMIAQAQPKVNQLQLTLNALEGVTCKISLTIQSDTVPTPDPDQQDHQGEITWPDKQRPNCSSTRPTKP